MYDILTVIRQRHCQYCGEWYNKPAATAQCSECHSKECCPDCLIPLESELLKNTVLKACSVCWEKDAAEIEAGQEAA